MSKYEPLESYLRGHRQEPLQLTFADIEAELGFELPPSARRHNAWWANDRTTHVQARAWLDAGWRVWEVDRSGERVEFRRRTAAADAAVQPTDLDFGPIRLLPEHLSPAAARLLRDYVRECGGDAQAAIARALNDAAMWRRSRLIDQIRANAPAVPGDSTKLIREDRDAR